MPSRGWKPGDVRNPSRKLTEDIVRNIRAIYRQKLATQRELADTFELHKNTVHKIIKHKIWKHIAD